MISRRRFLRGVWPLGIAALCASRSEAVVPSGGDFARPSATVRDAVARGDVPGAVLHVRSGGRVLYERAFGRKDIDADRALSADDLFPVASLTKPIVAAATLKLAETGALRLGDPVADYLPEFGAPRILVTYDPATGEMVTRPARRAMTIRDLLTHTAGIHHGHVETDRVLARIYVNAGVVFDSRLVLSEKIRRLGPLPLAHEPGARWTYGLSSDVLGRVVEVAAGMPLDQYLSRTIFGPLAMQRAYFFVPPAERGNVVSRYSRTGGKFRPVPRDPFEDEARHVSGGGGLVTTIDDYARFAQALLAGGGPILSPASVAAMTRNQIGRLSAFGFRWGYSLAVSTPDARGRSALPVGGFGWYGIYGTWFWAMPQREALVLLFANALRQDMTLPLFARVVRDTVRDLPGR